MEFLETIETISNMENLTGFAFAYLYGSIVIGIIIFAISIIGFIQICKVCNIIYKILKEYYKKLRKENEDV